MARKKAQTSFGQRLVAFRKARGMTQVRLAEAIGSTQRAVSYYETDAGHPPVLVIADLARALGVTTDELLGAESERRAFAIDPPDTQRAWRQFQQVLSLPEKDRRAVLRLINSLVAAQSARTETSERHRR